MRSDNPEKWRRRKTRRPQLRITIGSAYYGMAVAVEVTGSGRRVCLPALGR